MKKRRLSRKGFVIIFLSIVFVVAIFVICIISNFDLVLDGDTKMTIDVNSEYVEPGYHFESFNKNEQDDVKIDGAVDTSQIGEYKIYYTVKKSIRTITKLRIVTVVDSEQPAINLNGSGKMTIFINSSYVEPGYTATDNYDGDITSNVKVDGTVDTSQVGTYELTYSVSDSSSNDTTVKREVEVTNESAATSLPVLMYHFFYDSSKGEKPADSNFTDVVAFDSQVKYLVDNSYYFPSWSEVDSYLNNKEKLPEKSVVLTFDDGAASFFSEAYPVLKKYGVKGTSFIVTSWAQPDSKYDTSILSYESHSNNMHRGGCKGGHGGIFQCLDEKDALLDLTTSKKIANNATVFCYPFGDVTDNEISLVKKAGYLMAFTTKGGRIKPGMNKYTLPRVRISGGISLDTFKKLVN